MKKSSKSLFVSFFVIILTMILFIMPVFVMADESDMVKVYVFHAPDCSVCDQEFSYLESLDSYNKKFVVVKKELYTSIHGGTAGSDYTLGSLVADAFRKAGFKQADINGTPFIVISDVYARTAYNNNLEEVINEVYEEGDKDVVGCIESGKSNCIAPLENKISTKAIIILTLSAVIVIGLIVGVTIITNKKSED